jgi:hypothetical protein
VIEYFKYMELEDFEYSHGSIRLTQVGYEL